MKLFIQNVLSNAAIGNYHVGYNWCSSHKFICIKWIYYLTIWLRKTINDFVISVIIIYVYFILAPEFKFHVEIMDWIELDAF